MAKKCCGGERTGVFCECCGTRLSADSLQGLATYLKTHVDNCQRHVNQITEALSETPPETDAEDRHVWRERHRLEKHLEQAKQRFNKWNGWLVVLNDVISSR